VNPFYEALVERDSAQARIAADAVHGHERFLSVARFAVLAYAPSQHGKHALLACLAAYELREALGPRYDDVLLECAIYAAESRQPWSEPPILDPPAPDDAATEGFDDRRAAERWLARRWHNHGFARDYFREAVHDFEDLGHSLIVANAAWKLAALLGEQGRYAVLRTGVWEMAAHRGERYEEEGVVLDRDTLAARLIDTCVAAGGEIVSAHNVFLLDAAIECGDPAVLRRVCDYLTSTTVAVVPQPEAPIPDIPVYALARDCAATLEAHVVGRRMNAPRFIKAVDDNRLHGPSFAEWTFA
jgi:hypothetical protein